MRSGVLRLIFLAGLVLCCALPPGGCDKTPQLDVEKPESSPLDPVAPTTTSTSVELGRAQKELRHKAELGDVQSMIVLGRWYESRDTKADRVQARLWYERAADTGDAMAVESMKALNAREEAAAAAATREAQADAPTTEPVALPPPSTTRATTRPRNPYKLAWQDVIESINTTGFTTSVHPNEDGQFVAVAASPDRSINIFAAGPSGDDLQGVSLVLRIRNKADPGNSTRVIQSAAIAARVTNDNVNQKEVVEWVTKYLNTSQRSNEAFRNGWQISVTGPAAEGMRDPNQHLGTGVMIEMKK